MSKRAIDEHQLIEKIRHLSNDKVKEVEDFIEFLQQRSEASGLRHEATTLSDPIFRQIWDNPEDAVYDEF